MLRTLGDIVKSHRIARGLTQTNLANLIGTSVPTVEKYEQGLREPGIEALIRLAASCDLPLSVFLTPLDVVTLPPREGRHRETSARGARAQKRAEKRGEP